MASLKTVCLLTLLVAAFVADEASADLYADLKVLLGKYIQNSPNAFKIVEFKTSPPKYLPNKLFTYTIEAKIVETTCPKSNTENLDKCSLKPNGKTLFCNVLIQGVQGATISPTIAQHTCK